MSRDQTRIHTELAGLAVVRVRHPTAEERRTDPRLLGQGSSEKPSRTTLRRRQRSPTGDEQPPHRRLQRLIAFMQQVLRIHPPTDLAQGVSRRSFRCFERVPGCCDPQREEPLTGGNPQPSGRPRVPSSPQPSHPRPLRRDPTSAVRESPAGGPNSPNASRTIGPTARANISFISHGTPGMANTCAWPI